MPALAAAAGIVLTLSLANWQLNRAHEKVRLAARVEALAKDTPLVLSAAEVRVEDVEWRRVTVRGRFDPARKVLIDNRVRQGVVGYQVVMPLEVGKTSSGDSRYVLVNRGWVAGNPDRSQLPEVRTPEGVVEVSGVAVVPTRRFLELSDRAPEGPVWQNLTLDRYRQAFKIALQPVLIQQDSPLDDGLSREWDPPNLGVDMHYGYAFQWAALSLTILVFYLVTHVRRRAQEK